jgi:DNA invertase Pin-like site-specific DNA recombinase
MVVDSGNLRGMTKRTATAARLIGYVRVSTEDQASNGVSLEAQRKKLEAYVELYDSGELVDLVIDEGQSAKTLKRPGLQRALAMLETGKADGILIVKLDRLTRSVRDLGELLDRYFGEGKFALLSVADHIDTRTAGGRLVLNVLTSVAQWEREAIGERTKAALEHLRDAEGVALGGEALGWTRIEKTDANGRRIVRKIRSEAATVARIRDLHAAGKSLRDIAAVLTAEGHPTKRGGRWQAETVAKVVRRLQPLAA